MSRRRFKIDALEAELRAADHYIAQLLAFIEETQAREGRPEPRPPLGGTKIAGHLRMVYNDGVYIDGARLPWHVAREVEITPDINGISGVTGVTVTIPVEGTVEIAKLGSAGITTSRVVDPVLGDMREYVRRELAEAFPWLKLPEQQ